MQPCTEHALALKDFKRCVYIRDKECNKRTVYNWPTSRTAKGFVCEEFFVSYRRGKQES